MREFKFRAWDIEKKLMWDSVVSLTRPEQTPFCLVRNKSDATATARPRHFLEILQFTELQDKSGKEIYEGDVVAYEVPPIHSIGVVGFKEGCFVLIDEDRYRDGEVSKDKPWDDDHGIHSFGDWVKSLFAIGNIFENPELLQTSNNAV